MRELTETYARADIGSGDTHGTISVSRTDDRDPHGEDRVTYRWDVFIKGVLVESQADLRTGVGNDPGPEQMLATLCAFLTAASEAYTTAMAGRTSDNAGLFREAVCEWAYMNSDEITMLQVELEHTGDWN